MSGKDAPEETNWLTQDEMHTWLALNTLIRQLPIELDSKTKKDAGLSLYEYVILAMLSQQETGVLSMTALAEVTSGSASRLSHAMERLEAGGLAGREKCKDDKRIVFARISDKGVETIQRAAPAHLRAVREAVFDKLDSSQVKALGEALRAINSA